MASEAESSPRSGLFPRVSLGENDPVNAAIRAAIEARMAVGTASLGDVLLLLADFVTSTENAVAAGEALSPTTMDLYWRAHLWTWVIRKRYPGPAGLATPWREVATAWRTSGWDGAFPMEQPAARITSSVDRHGQASEAEPAPRTWGDKKARAAELKQAGLSDRQVGRRLGIDGKTARRWAEAGGWKYPGPPTPRAETA